MNQFENVLIGTQDISGNELKNGDEITIEVCKPDGFNRGGVYHKGKIVYENMAFCILKTDLRTTPLTNYASTCIITKTN